MDTIVGSDLNPSEVLSDDFLGSVHTKTELITDSFAILHLPKRFAWNSISVAPVNGGTTTYTILLTLSSPKTIANGSAIWIELSDYVGLTEASYYMWEHPITAFAFKGTGTIFIDMVSKQD